MYLWGNSKQKSSEGFSPRSAYWILSGLVFICELFLVWLITSGWKAKVGVVTDGKLWAFVYLFELGSRVYCTAPMKTDTPEEIRLLLCILTGSGMLTLGILAGYVGTSIAAPQDWVRLEQRGP